MRKFKTYQVQIWFLDEDLQQSAMFLNDKQLNKTINGCFNALCAAYFYFVGIRSVKFYKHFFSKEHKAETMDRLFPCWPLKVLPKFQCFASRQSKWCRKCKEHLEYVKQYLEVLLNEYDYRTGKCHGLRKFLEWLEYDALKLKIPEGKLNKIVLDWKVLQLAFRRKDIIQGYRLQYKKMLSNYGIGIQDFTKRDVPDWLMSKQDSWLV